MSASEGCRRIAITGVSRGLGRALAEELARAGHIVSGCARSTDPIDELKQRWPEPHDWQAVDVRRDDAVRRWAEHVRSRGGPPDLLVNNAGLINANAPLWQVPAEAFSDVVDVNVKGVANTIRHFVPAMMGRGRGVIVNFSSAWGRSVAPNVAPYCATKWAVEGLTRALAEELPPGMAAVPVNPGVIDTAILRSCFGSGAANYPNPESWARRAVPFLLGIGPEDNGRPVTVSG